MIALKHLAFQQLRDRPAASSNGSVPMFRPGGPCVVKRRGNTTLAGCYIMGATIWGVTHD
jgi:hypothetical protein